MSYAIEREYIAHQDTLAAAVPGKGTMPVAADPLSTAPSPAGPAAATAAGVDSFPSPWSSEAPRCSDRSPEIILRCENVHRCLPGHVYKLQGRAREMTMQAGE